VSVGIKSQDGAWDFALWARNLTDTYYWNSVADNADLLVRFPGQTRTFGLSLTHNFQ
jgi:outer membrane receptor protein involved in Fe transport